jgi:hypothetical protein
MVTCMVTGMVTYMVTVRRGRGTTAAVGMASARA